ncbi:Oidioi.mRNA.OKI2018_I69.PAR.g12257.t1.cds [Oikopleura dioica]|uniref:Oidioi.mRNA.OKI2018_I69.PAR.g12257.t1.cds n=1 Tax=Oikopleura dioica TaxID=34765 RepID=A0ABN7RZ83_OIKDI|nr:Oidioi.mRNA.OKI2018_I69.PAR.g12257.t1.cds [Oikopleura dioica]
MIDIPPALRDKYDRDFADLHPGSWDKRPDYGDPQKVRIPRGQLDPHTDPGFTRAASWAAKNSKVLSKLGVFPVSDSAWLVVNWDVLDSETNAIWSLKPGRDPALLYALASDYYLVRLEPREREDPPQNGGEAQNVRTDWTEPVLCFLKKDITARALRTVLSNLIQLELGPETRTTLSDLVLECAAQNVHRKFSQGLVFSGFGDQESMIRIILTSVPTFGKKKSFIKPVNGALKGLNGLEGDFRQAWLSWLPKSRLGPLWSYHKMLLTSVLTDSFWNYITCKVLETTPDELEKRELRPDPEWWFNNLVAFATVDLLAMSEEIPNSLSHPKDFIEAIVANAAATEKWVSKDTLQKAKVIRENLTFPTKDRDRKGEGLRMRLILNNAVACGIERLTKYLETGRLLPLAAARHPFWRLKIRAQLAKKLAEQLKSPGNGKMKGRLAFKTRDWRRAIMEKTRTTFEFPVDFCDYSLTPEDKADPILSLFREVLEGFKERKLTAEVVSEWYKDIRQTSEQTILKQRRTFWEKNPLVNDDWETIRKATPDNHFDLARFSFEQAAKKNAKGPFSKMQLTPDPWFEMVKDHALSNADSDLAWQIPDDFWEVAEAAGSRAWKIRAARLAKAGAVGVFAAKICNETPDIPLADPLHAVVEYAAQTLRHPAEYSLREAIEVVADNLRYSCSETGEKPCEVWKKMEQMATSVDVRAVFPPPELENTQNSFLLMHRVPSASKSKLHFQWIGNDAERAKESILWKKEHPWNKIGSVMTIEKATAILNDLAEFRPTEAAMLLKSMAKSRPAGEGIVLVATSEQAQQNWVDLATAKLPKDEEPSAIWQEAFASLEFAELSSVNKASPVLLRLIEHDENRGLFRWQRLIFRETDNGMRSIIWNTHNLVAPGKVRILRDFVSWGKGHLSNRHIRKSEKEREISIRGLRENGLQTMQPRTRQRSSEQTRVHNGNVGETIMAGSSVSIRFGLSPYKREDQTV